MVPEAYMRVCFLLALKGHGNVAPNPLVGCVIVDNDEIIGEGYHACFGKEHAEVNAINSVKEKQRIKNATLYVNLEPCDHFGKTPPCTELIILSGIKKVFIATSDTNPLVAGKGIEKLKSAGIEVVMDVLKDEARTLNKRFFTLFEQKRPYVILKWAQTSDGFISKWPVPIERKNNIISCKESQLLVHVWRSQEQAVLVGHKTVWADNPELTVRLVGGKNPIRVTIDSNLRIPNAANIYNEAAKTIVFHSEKIKNHSNKNAEFVPIHYIENNLETILEILASKRISSLLVEGGRKILESFITQNLYDEIRVFTSNKNFGRGIEAPFLSVLFNEEKKVGDDLLQIYYRNT